MFGQISTVSPVTAIPRPALFAAFLPPSPAICLITVRCDLCNDAERGPASQHINNGWYLGRGEQFCSACNTPD